MTVKLKNGDDRHKFWGSDLGGNMALQLPPLHNHPSPTKILSSRELQTRAPHAQSGLATSALPASAASATSATAWCQGAQAEPATRNAGPSQATPGNLPRYILKPDTQIARTTSESQCRNR